MDAVVLNGLGDPSEDVREQSLELLQSLDESDLNIYLDYALHDPSGRVRVVAVRRLTEEEEGLDHSIPTLAKVLADDGVEHVRKTVVGGYFCRPPNSYVNLLRKAVEDPSPGVVRSALNALSYCDTPAELPANQIKTLSLHDDHLVREALTRYLSELSQTELRLEILKTLTSDPSPRVREGALEAFTEIAKAGEVKLQRGSIKRVSPPLPPKNAVSRPNPTLRPVSAPGRLPERKIASSVQTGGQTPSQQRNSFDRYNKKNR